MVKRILGAGLALALLGAGSAAAQVAYVGDSLGVGTAPALRERLPGVSIDVDAQKSRPSSAGLGLLEGMLDRGHDVVVFDLGTNDDPAAPQALAANLAAARELSGDRCLVIATLNRPPLNGVTVDGLNRAVESFAATDAGTRLVDWHAAAAAEPSLLTDGVHATAEGYAMRAHLFADAIRSCIAGAPPKASTDPELEREVAPDPEPRTPEPQRARPGPVEEAAAQLAKAIVVGAEFG